MSVTVARSAVVSGVIILVFCLVAAPYIKTSSAAAKISQAVLQSKDPITIKPHMSSGRKSWSMLFLLGQVLSVDHFRVVRKKFRRRKDGSIYPLERAVNKRRTILPVVLDGHVDVLKTHTGMFGGSSLSVNAAIKKAADDHGPFVGSDLDDQVGEGIRANGKDPEKILDGIFEEQDFYPAMLAQQSAHLPRWMGTDAILPKVDSEDFDDGQTDKPVREYYS